MLAQVCALVGGVACAPHPWALVLRLFRTPAAPITEQQRVEAILAESKPESSLPTATTASTPAAPAAPAAPTAAVRSTRPPRAGRVPRAAATRRRGSRRCVACSSDSEDGGDASAAGAQLREQTRRTPAGLHGYVPAATDALSIREQTEGSVDVIARRLRCLICGGPPTRCGFFLPDEAWEFDATPARAGHVAAMFYAICRACAQIAGIDEHVEAIMRGGRP